MIHFQPPPLPPSARPASQHENPSTSHFARSNGRHRTSFILSHARLSGSKYAILISPPVGVPLIVAAATPQWAIQLDEHPRSSFVNPLKRETNGFGSRTNGNQHLASTRTTPECFFDSV
jgi:hypothetical protein